MVTKNEVLELVAKGHSYESVGEMLGVPPGQAYLVATGLPADGSDGLAPEDRDRAGIRFGSVQALVNPEIHPSSKPEQAMSFLKHLASNDTVMRDAATKRDATPPPLELPEDDEKIYDVVDVLGRDHGQVNYLLKQLKTVPPYSESKDERHAERRQSIVDMMVATLAGHEGAEEAFFWPAVAEWLGDRGESFAKQATAQEQEAKEAFAEIAALTGTEERFDELALSIEGQLRKHVAFEDMVFLEVKSSTKTPARVELGRKVVSAERRGPTRPHPKAGSSLTSQRLAPVVGAVDKARDAVSGRPAERKGQAEAELADEAG